MLRRGAATLVETLLHELVHATAFIDGDVDFNESVAQFIGQEAAVRFFAGLETDPPTRWPSAARVADAIADRRLVAEHMIAFRETLSAMESDPERAEKRQRAEAHERELLARLPLRELDAERVSRVARLSDACLALRGTYIRDLPRHARVLAALDGNLAAMVERLELWAREERDPEAFYEIGRPEVFIEAADSGAER
jgi:predicted aminopeptidase